jgi:hypothetical protein
MSLNSETLDIAWSVQPSNFPIAGTYRFADWQPYFRINRLDLGAVPGIAAVVRRMKAIFRSLSCAGGA